MKTIKPSSEYGAHWGLTDLYAEDAANLKQALKSGEDFVFDYGCKKETHYCTVRRTDGILKVSARAYIDEIDDITDAVMWEAFGGNDYADSGYGAIAKYHDLDPAENESRILDILEECSEWFVDIYQECFDSEVVMDDCRDFDAVMDVIAGLEEEVANAAHQCYEDMVECAKESISAIAEQDNMHRYV